ncbi:unnamed protein product [Cercopithifilaria johnstoni]|uniref:Negative elongation factor E n=1 Tax=Cercopithifilaria johnstoni TaxID=2874296 RepID=A0A8J2Q5X3_9BILA|nr:unnamed protein product [Cercopithifilaria johnstoni]
MRSLRDTGLLFPSTFSSDEKRLKEIFEKLRTIRKAIAATNKVNVNATVGDNLKTERKTTKRHLQQAEEATEEVKRKVLIGAMSFKKVDERKDSFKRSSLVGRRRGSGKAKIDSDTVINSNTEFLPPSADNGNNKPLSSDDHSGTKKKSEEPSDSLDTHKSPIDFDTGKSAASNVPGTSGSSSTSKRILASGTSSSSDTCVSVASDTFDTYKARDGSSSFDNYKPINLSDSGDFDASGPSPFDIYKPTSIGGNEFDNYKSGSAQPFSFDTTSGSSPFIGFERPKPCRGPCLYIRGYDLVADSLQNVFSKYGVINRVFVEERQKSAFITYATTEEAEAAIKEMDGNMVNGITLRVSFARRQNQCGDSGHFRSSESFDRGNDGDEKNYSNRSRSERSGRFLGNERIRFRGEKSGRGRGRGRMCESGESLLSTAFTETSDDFWSKNKSSNDESTVQASRDKDDFWSARRLSTGRMSEPNVEKDKEGNGFDTYKSAISAGGGDDLNVSNNEDDDFDIYKSFSDEGGNSSSNCQKNLGKRRGNYEHLRDERQGGFCDDRYRNFRGGRRHNGIPPRGSRNRGGPLWWSRKQSNELKDVNYCSTDNFNTGRESSCLTGDESEDKGEHSKSDSANRESESLGKNDDGKDDFGPSCSRRSNYEGGESCPFSVARSGSDQSFRRSTGGDYRSGRRGGNRGGRFRRQRCDIDNKSTWSDEEGKSCYDEWPDVNSRPLRDSWFASVGDKMPNSPPPPPPMSEVQVAWSEATKKTSKGTAAATKREEITAMQRKLEIRKQVSYDEDDPFA